MDDRLKLSGMDRFRGALVCGAVVVPAVVYTFRLASFLEAKEAALSVFLVLAAVSGVLGKGRRYDWRGGLAYLPLWIVLVFSVSVHLMLEPARVRSDVVIELVRCAVLLSTAFVAFGLLRDPVWRNRVTGSIVFSGVVVALLGLVQYTGYAPQLFPTYEGYDQRVYSVFGNQDLLGGYIAIALSLGVARVTGNPKSLRWLWVLALVPLIPGLLVSGCRTAWLATVVGVLVAVFHRRPVDTELPPSEKRRVRLTVAAIFVAMVLLTVIAAPDLTINRASVTFSEQDTGGRLRLWFWDGTLRMIREHPVTGVGLGNYAYWSPRYFGDALWPFGGELHMHNELHTVHAHSEPLEILAETGLVGFACCLWMLVRLLWRRGPEWAGLAALLVFSLFNSPFHSAPHALAGLLLAGALLARDEPEAPPASETGAVQSPAPWVVLVASLVLAAFSFKAVIVPSCLLRRAEDLHLAGEPAIEAYQDIPRPSATVREKLGIAYLEAGQYEPAREQFLAALEGLDTGAVYLALGAADVALDDKDSARKWLNECVLRWPSNEDAWLLLLRSTPPSDQDDLLKKARPWLSGDGMARLEAETGP